MKWKKDVFEEPKENTIKVKEGAYLSNCSMQP